MFIKNLSKKKLIVILAIILVVVSVAFYLFFDDIMRKYQISSIKIPSQGATMLLFRELDEDTLKWNIILFDYQKGEKRQVNSEPIGYVGAFYLTKTKALWIDESDLDNHIIHIYDIATQKEEKEFSFPYRANNLHLYENLIVFDSTIKGTGFSKKGDTFQVFLYNIDNQQIQEISGQVTEPSVNSRFCLSGNNDKVVFEDRNAEQVKFNLYNLTTGKKEVLPKSINASIICPQINENRIMYAVCDCDIEADSGFQEDRLSSSETGGKLTFKIFDLASGKDKVIKEIQWEEGIVEGWRLLGDKITYDWSVTKWVLTDVDKMWQKMQEIDITTGKETTLWSN